MNIINELLTKPCTVQLRSTLSKYITDNYFFVNNSTIGTSVLNRPIEQFTIGNSKSKVLMCGAFHGMEWITSSLLYIFIINISDAIINHNLLSNKKIWQYFNKHSLCVIPCVNPDGVEISINGAKSAKHMEQYVERISGGDTLHWQSNALGVDLNHNFNADWQNVKARELAMGIVSPAKTRFGGEYAESERETQIIADFCRKEKLHSAIAFHSQGEEIYWDFGKSTPKESEKKAEKMAELSGYTISRPESIATGGGFKDWLIDELNVPAFTVEVGRGTNPLNISDLPNIYSRLEEMLIEFLVM